jgi:hypothetical protein
MEAKPVGKELTAGYVFSYFIFGLNGSCCRDIKNLEMCLSCAKDVLEASCSFLGRSRASGVKKKEFADTDFAEAKPPIIERKSRKSTGGRRYN